MNFSYHFSSHTKKNNSLYLYYFLINILIIENFSNIQAKIIDSYNSSNLISFLDDSNNPKILIFDLEIYDNLLLLNLLDVSKYKKYKLFLDTLLSDAFIFDNSQQEYFENRNYKKIFFHSDFFYTNNSKNLNFSSLRIKNFLNNNFHNVTNLEFINLPINHDNNNKKIQINSSYSLYNELDSKIIGSLSISRESDEKDFFEKIKIFNNNIYTKDFILDIKNKKIIFGLIKDYKNINLTEIYKENNNVNNISIINEYDFISANENKNKTSSCNFYDKSDLFAYKKINYFNCYFNYLYLGNNFTSKKEEIESYYQFEFNKVALFDTLTKYIIFPIESLVSANNNIIQLNYLHFYTNLIKDKNNQDFVCFISENSLNEKVNKTEINLNDNNLHFINKKLYCLSKFNKEYLLKSSENYFVQQNLILNGLSYELKTKNLLDEIKKDDISFVLKNYKIEKFYSNNIQNNNQDSEYLKKLEKNYLESNFFFEYKIIFYNPSYIQKHLEEEKHDDFAFLVEVFIGCP